MGDREDMLQAAEAIASNAGLRMLLQSIAALRGDLAMLARPMPAPVVQVDAPDLSAIVTAVNGLKPGVDADEIARAIQRVIQPPSTEGGGSLATEAIVDALKKIEFRLQGAVGPPAFGASGPSNISDNPIRELGLVTVKNPNGPAPNQVRLIDYDVRSDTNPVYIGYAPVGSATSAAVWTVQKLTYDGSNRLTETETLSSVIWDNRSSLPW